MIEIEVIKNKDNIGDQYLLFLIINNKPESNFPINLSASLAM